MTKIYTRKGDGGETSLVTGERVPKCDPRVDAYGDVDELISVLAGLRCGGCRFAKLVRTLQQDLMLVSAWVATAEDVEKMRRITVDDVSRLEGEIDRITEKLPPLKSFVLPSGPDSAALCHLARTVCRRAERKVVGLGDARESIASAAAYLNRLSDLLFVMARSLSAESPEGEDFWIPEKS